MRSARGFHATQGKHRTADIAPTAFCQKARCSASSAFWPTTAIRRSRQVTVQVLVVECSTMSKPSSSGRWMYGLAKVLSATLMIRGRGQMRAMAARSDQAQQRIGRYLRPLTMRVSSVTTLPPTGRSGRRS